MSLAPRLSVHLLAVAAFLTALCAAASAVAQTSEDAMASPPSVAQYLVPREGRTTATAVVPNESLLGKVLCGYQGWFAAPADGFNRGWYHWEGPRGFRPGSCSIDLWPDVSELGPDERHETEFRHADGRPACVYSSTNPDTVDRHFRWMREYGIDGVFCQRFSAEVANPSGKLAFTAVLSHCREAANRHGRVYAVMYDTEWSAAALENVRRDWLDLRRDMRITEDPAYLRHRGRPLVALWGFGFTHYAWDADAAAAILDFLRNDAEFGGCSIMLGVPTWYRDLHRDCRDDPRIRDLMEKADVISPWTVGRYADPDGARRHAREVWAEDIGWCRARGLDYLPVVYPGYSFHNARPDDMPLDSIPRRAGQFFWTQVRAARAVGAEALYVAMFDEVDEGTAVFKCTNDPPVGHFLTYEGLPTDHYLRLTGQAGRLIRGDIVVGPTLPQP